MQVALAIGNGMRRSRDGREWRVNLVQVDRIYKTDRTAWTGR